MNDLNKEIFEINKKANSNNKSKIKENRINSLKKRPNRSIENNDNENIYYKTYNNLNDSSYININKSNQKNIRLEYNIMYFPTEKYLIKKKEDINKLESELDLLYKEKDKLEKEIIKIPLHPKTLKEIKIKRALNDKISLNENCINKVKIQIRKIKEI